MSKQAAQERFIKLAKMRGAEAAIRGIVTYAFEYAGFNFWDGEKEMRQYMNYGNDAVYAVVTRSREHGMQVESWHFDSKSAKVRKMNADMVEQAKADFETAKAELIAMI